MPGAPGLGGGGRAPGAPGRTGMPGFAPAALAAAAFCACCLFLFTTHADSTSTAPAAPSNCSLSTMSEVRWPKVVWSRMRFVPSHTNGSGLPAESVLSMTDLARSAGVTGWIETMILAFGWSTPLLALTT